MGEQWIAVIGSPRKEKNTDLMVDYVIEGLNEKKITVDKYFLESHNISTCTGCGYCIKTGNCIIQDDVTVIIDNMRKADGYVFASPSYNYNMTAQMKSLLDRTFCLNDYSDGWESRLSPDKKAIEYEFMTIDNKNILAIKVLNSKEIVLFNNCKYIIENNEITKCKGEIILDKTKVFIVHGHDNLAKQETARFIE